MSNILGVVKIYFYVYPGEICRIIVPAGLLLRKGCHAKLVVEG